MVAPVNPIPLGQELAAAHALGLECAARAGRRGCLKNGNPSRPTHGCRSRELIGLRRRAAGRLRSLTRALSAGHGVHRSNLVAPLEGRSHLATLCRRP